MAGVKRRKVESADALEDDLEYDIGSDSAANLETIDEDSDSSPENDETSAGDAEDEEQAASTVRGPSTAEKREKRKARKQLVKSRKAEEDSMEQDSVMSVDQQSDLFANLTRTYAPRDLSSIEINDLSIPTSSFLDTTAFAGSRTLETVVSFMRHFSERETLEVAPKQVGTPHTLLLTSSAIRVADLTRSLKQLRQSSKGKIVCDVAKLFGKEKVAVQCEWLLRTRVNVAVGVPSRVTSCIASGALKVDRVEQIYLDTTYRDSKRRGMITIKEVAAELMRLLQLESLHARIVSGACKVVLF